MINVFWDSSIENWNISTKNSVGGNIFFYKTDNNKSFKHMFDDAIKDSKLDLNILNKLYCYSFVLQHPEHRIVSPIKTTCLYLVQVFQITNVESQCNVNVISMETIKTDSMWLNTEIRFPKIYTDEVNYTDINNKYNSTDLPYSFCGVTIKNIDTNDRCKIINPSYMNVWKLKGNQPKLQYQYLILRKNGKIKEYLTYYPEHASQFTKYRENLHVFTNTLYNMYVKCYIKKENPLINFSLQYRTHLFKIHQNYVIFLKPSNKYVTLSVVINYVNNLHESIQMSSLNYHYKLKQ